jgi:catechol 2,3-dioxygenase-like lactoylglutathione lyase family enzyme
MLEDAPSIWVGHVVLFVRDPAACGAFYEKLGMRPVERGAGVTVLALRGGTHLVVIKRSDAPASAARFDLMVEDHAETRAAWEKAGVPVSPITTDARNGHEVFTVTDPEGNTVVVNDSHVTAAVG